MLAAAGAVLLMLIAGAALSRAAAWPPGQSLYWLRSPHPTAVVIGDSQAHGARQAQLRETWVTQGVVGAGYAPAVLGGGGTGFVRSYNGAPSYLDGLRQGAYTLPAEGVSLVVVEGGGNDSDHPDEQIQAAAQESLELVQDHYYEADIVMVGPLGRGEDLRRKHLNELLAQVAREADVPFLDASLWGRHYQLDGLFYEDGIHLTEAGHEQLADPFTAQLQELELTLSGELSP